MFPLLNEASFRGAGPPQYVRNPYYVVLTFYYLLVTDLGVISPHFEWQSNRKQVRPLEGVSKKRFQTLRPSLEKSGGVLKLEPFFLIVAARRVARCLLYSSYTAKFHSGIQTRSRASPSDVSSTRLSQTKSDLGVIIPHFGWQSNQKQVRPLESAFAFDVMMRSSKTE